MNNHEFLQIIQDITQQITQKTHLGDYADYATTKQELLPFLPNGQANDTAQLAQAIAHYCAHSVNTNHPQFANQLWSGQSKPAILGDILAVLTNSSSATFETAPLATVIENHIMKYLLQYYGFAGGEGLMATGGSHGNMMGMMLARANFYGDDKRRGLAGKHKAYTIINTEAHYSFDKAANILGLGTDSLLKIATNDHGQMDINAVEKLCQERNDIMMIVATAGTTVRGAFDNIAELARIAQQYKIWLHVDGAWGGAVQFSPTHRHLLAGLHWADSFCFDAHKMLGIPLICSFFMAKNRGLFDQYFTAGDGSYIFHNDEDTQERLNLGANSLLCGRRVDILKFWLDFYYYGEQGFARRIDNCLDNAQYFAQLVQNHPNLQLQSPQIINNVCFRYVAPQIGDVNEFNRQLRQSLYHHNQALFNIAQLGEELTLRLVLTSQHQTRQSCDELLAMIIAKAKEMLA